MSSVILSLPETHTQALVLVKKFLDGVSFISKINRELLALISQILDVPAELVAVERELSQLFVLVG